MNIIKEKIASLKPSSIPLPCRIGRSGSMAMAVLAALAGLTSCSDWDDHYDNSGVVGSNTTLWEQITSRPELSDFAEVLNSTSVFRQHKKTSVSYASLLEGGQALTVFAPVNGTFNKDSLIALTETAKGDSAVEKVFVKNHLAGTLRSATDSTVAFRLLNGKNITMQKDAVGGIPFKDSNLRGKNGVMHVIQSQMPYSYTVYEAMTQLDWLQSVGNVIAGYNEDYFNEDASLSSGLVDGVPVYVDSVITERNILINSIGRINDEDSTYFMTIPTNAGWEKAWNEALSYYKYSSAMEKGDSLQRYWTSRALLEDAVFSRTVQSSPMDSLVSWWYSKSTPQYHVFYRPFDSDGLLGKAKGMLKCSNGSLYYHDEWPFTPVQTYFKKIEQEAESTWNILSYTLCSYNGRSLNADSISKGAYLDIVPSSGTANWTVKYKISNTLSGKYDFCVVVLPKTVEGPLGNMRPCKFKAAINYIDENGVAQTYNCGGGTFTNTPDRVDTIMVAEGFKLPACNFDQNNDKVSVTITCSISAKEAAKYNREMYLDCIFLRPNYSKEQ